MVDLRDAASALARGDALRALGLVGAAAEPDGLLLKGIAYAQMGDVERGREVLLRAHLEAASSLTKARIKAALIEIDLERGDLVKQARGAARSADDLEALGDRRNAAMQRLVAARAEVLLGRLGDAQRSVDAVLEGDHATEVRAVACLARAEIAVRAIAPTRAKEALADARRALEASPNALLARAIVSTEAELTRYVARLESGGESRAADLFVIEAASAGDSLLVDACRRLVIAGRASIPLARRPILFALLLLLARAWPSGIPRDALAASAFGVRRVNESHRARLRVEVGRLRKLLDGIGEPVATKEGYALQSSRRVLTLLPPSDDDDARIAILLSDGAAWSAQAVAEHAGVSKRTAQRVLRELALGEKIRRIGSGREVRYASAGERIASRLLLLGLLPRT